MKHPGHRTGPGDGPDQDQFGPIRGAPVVRVRPRREGGRQRGGGTPVLRRHEPLDHLARPGLDDPPGGEAAVSDSMFALDGGYPASYISSAP